MFEKGGVPMFDIHRPNVCEIPILNALLYQIYTLHDKCRLVGTLVCRATLHLVLQEDVMFFVSRR